MMLLNLAILLLAIHRSFTGHDVQLLVRVIQKLPDLSYNSVIWSLTTARDDEEAERVHALSI